MDTFGTIAHIFEVVVVIALDAELSERLLDLDCLHLCNSSCFFPATDHTFSVGNLTTVLLVQLVPLSNNGLRLSHFVFVAFTLALGFYLSRLSVSISAFTCHLFLILINFKMLKISLKRFSTALET